MAFPLPRALALTTLRRVRERLIDGLLHGDRLPWAVLGALWILTAIVVLVHRPAIDAARSRRSGAAFALALLALGTATSLAGLPLSAALSIPRIQWKPAEAPELVASAGSTWRKLRGPAVALPGPDPDIGVPTIDASDRWVLVGLLSGKPAPGLPAAEPVAAAPGAPRLCVTEGTECRAWPVAWPDPARPAAVGELLFSRHAPPYLPLAFDAETGLYLIRIEPAPGMPSSLEGPHFETIGRASAEPKLEGPQVVFVARSVTGGRLKAARVAAMPDPARPGGFTFQLHRANASLTAGPRAFAWIARPVLTLTALAFPIGVTAYLIARRRRAVDRALPWIEALAAFAAGLAAAAPAVVAVASLWGSR